MKIYPKKCCSAIQAAQTMLTAYAGQQRNSKFAFMTHFGTGLEMFVQNLHIWFPYFLFNTLFSNKIFRTGAAQSIGFNETTLPATLLASYNSNSQLQNNLIQNECLFVRGQFLGFQCTKDV